MITLDSDVDRFHFDVSSFPPAVARQQISLEVDNKPLKFILPFEVKYSSVTSVCIKVSLCLLFMLKFFRVINFRRFHYPRKFFSNKIFPDHGTFLIYNFQTQHNQHIVTQV